MNYKTLRICLLVAIVLAGWVAVGHLVENRAEAAVRYRTPPNLFYNYYVPAVGCPGIGARLYVCPRPTPPLVGHTYVTYEPLMPHEFLWKHCRVYKRKHPDGKCTRTMVLWR